MDLLCTSSIFFRYGSGPPAMATVPHPANRQAGCGDCQTSSGAEPPMPFDSADALSLLLTTEALLLAALTISVVLTEPSPSGRNPLVARGWLAIAVALAITAVATGAGAAWVDLFTHPWPVELTGGIEAVAVAVGIGGQPLFAWWIALGVARLR